MPCGHQSQKMLLATLPRLEVEACHLRGVLVLSGVLSMVSAMGLKSILGGACWILSGWTRTAEIV